MSDKQPTQASGGTGGKRDGVSDIASRKGGGESGGGAYADKNLVKRKGEQSGFLGHGGQSEIDYHGPDNPNETTGGNKP